VNYHLKKYILNTKSQGIRLGIRLRVDESAFDTIALVSNPASDKIALVSLMTDVFGETSIKSYLVNRKKYDWARAEGFGLDEMLELIKEKIFIQIPSDKLANHLL
tara:strand:- start:1114 stop:1428 length:315 start_codon:yes stop_codon:yes gene_type:complete